MSKQISVLNVPVIYRRLVLQDLFIQLEIVSVMMKLIMFIAAMIMAIVVYLM